MYFSTTGLVRKTINMALEERDDVDDFLNKAEYVIYAFSDVLRLQDNEFYNKLSTLCPNCY